MNVNGTELNNDPFPDVVRIETAGLCNLRCRHCVVRNKPNKRGLLGSDNFSFILDQLGELNVMPRVLVLYHGGEPLLNENLESFIRRAKELGVKKTVITTNGSLLDNHRAKGIVEAGLDELKISLDGESAEENDYIRRKGSFCLTAENIRNLVRVKDRLKSETPRIIVANTRIAHKKDLTKMCERNNFIFDCTANYIQDHFADIACDVVFTSYPARLWPILKHNEDFEIVKFDLPKPNYCESIYETITVLCNGEVVPCCDDLTGEQVFGNVFADDLMKIWTGEKYTLFRDNFRKRIYTEMCSNCSLISKRFLTYRE